MLFGIEAADLLLIAVLAVVMFGPEKIPEFSRKIARVVVGLRELANNAQTQLKEELGPEYADLELADLNPKSFVKKHLSNEIAMIEETKAELELAGKEIKEASSELKSATEDVKGLATQEIEDAKKSVKETKDDKPKFDIEAT